MVKAPSTTTSKSKYPSKSTQPINTSFESLKSVESSSVQLQVSEKKTGEDSKKVESKNGSQSIDIETASTSISSTNTASVTLNDLNNDGTSSRATPTANASEKWNGTTNVDGKGNVWKLRSLSHILKQQQSLEQAPKDSDEQSPDNKDSNEQNDVKEDSTLALDGVDKSSFDKATEVVVVHSEADIENVLSTPTAPVKFSTPTAPVKSVKSPKSILKPVPVSPPSKRDVNDIEIEYENVIENENGNGVLSTPISSSPSGSEASEALSPPLSSPNSSSTSPGSSPNSPVNARRPTPTSNSKHGKNPKSPSSPSPSGRSLKSPSANTINGNLNTINNGGYSGSARRYNNSGGYSGKRGHYTQYHSNGNRHHPHSIHSVHSGAYRNGYYSQYPQYAQYPYYPQYPTTNPSTTSTSTPLSTSQTTPSMAKMQILRQIEYYFGVENLCRDIYLRQQMDADGYVPLSVLTEFNRVKSLVMSARRLSGAEEVAVESSENAPDTKDNSKEGGGSGESVLKNALEGSTVVELSEDGLKIRKRDKWELWILPARTEPSLTNTQTESTKC